MPKIITDPIKTGAKSKIYLLAYPKPITGYAIGKKLRPDSAIPPTSRVYNNLKEMKHDGLIIKTSDDLNFSEIEPLLNALKKEFDDKEIIISDQDTIFLSTFLDTLFREYMKDTIESIDATQDISAYQILTQGLGGFAFTYTVYNDKVKKSVNDKLKNYELKKNTDGWISGTARDIYGSINISDKLLKALMTFAPPYLNKISISFDGDDPRLNILFK